MVACGGVSINAFIKTTKAVMLSRVAGLSSVCFRRDAAYEKISVSGGKSK